MNLSEIANTPGFGSGKRARDQLAAMADLRKKLPYPRDLPPVMASIDPGSNWLLASFGNSGEDGNDWHLVTCNVRGLEFAETAFGDAKLDAEMVAVILNAYREGVLVIAPE